MKFRNVFFLTLLCGILALALPVQAQFTQDPDDLGAADTIEIVFSVTPDYTTNQLQVQADLWVFDDANSIIGVSSGFAWENSNLQMDSAVASPMTDAGFDIGPFFYEDDDINLTNTNQRFIFGAAVIFGAGVTANPTRQLWASYYFTLSDWQVCDSIVLDTLLFSPSSLLKFVTTGNAEYVPYWTGRIVIRDTACSMANLIVNPDSLHFDAIENGSTPPPQTFTVASDGIALNFNLVENIPWIIVSPITGTTTQQITVLPNTIGLAAGTYIDSIMVESGQANNSPLWVKVTMTVEEPPPVIGVTPTEFFFNAIAGGANPGDKILTIYNNGGQTLNWTATNSESWLSLSPTSGVDSVDVTVSVDITGLPFGNYTDYIVISDPNATNSPESVMVSLSIGSDLPIIEVDSAFNFVVVPTGVSEVDPRTILVKNGGAGTMNFWLEENSPRLFTMNPDSGVAPQDVEVTFKLTGGSAGDDYFDTLWVYSNEAINSPFPVVFQFHLVDNPAQINLTTDTLRFTLYECEMGAGVDPPTALFQVLNVGGDDPMTFDLVYESDLFELTAISNEAPGLVIARSAYLNLPVGVYFDTIEIVAQKAINNPETLIVKYEVIPGTETPEIHLSRYSFVIPAQENSGPVPPSALEIHNKFGGCMDWAIVEDVPWMTPSDSSGTNPKGVSINADATGYLFGEYPDSFFVTSTVASNSPVKVDLLFRVWRFHGDMNYDGVIDVSDLTYFVDYLFQSGPGPEPEYFVGDLNCDHTVNIEDLTYFVHYFFESGPIPCGNPFK